MIKRELPIDKIEERGYSVDTPHRGYREVIHMNQKFNVTGMSCSACSAAVEKSVGKLSGVRSVNVNLLSNSMAVDYDEAALDSGGIIHAVEEAG